MVTNATNMRTNINKLRRHSITQSQTKSSNTVTPAQISAGGEQERVPFFIHSVEEIRVISIKAKKDIESPIPWWMQVKGICCS
jgi:hypothetical protein